MPQINVPVSVETYNGCKTAAARAGMKFKVWVERTLAAHIDPRDRPKPAGEAAKELKYVADDAP